MNSQMPNDGGRKLIASSDCTDPMIPVIQCWAVIPFVPYAVLILFLVVGIHPCRNFGVIPHHSDPNSRIVLGTAKREHSYDFMNFVKNSSVFLASQFVGYRRHKAVCLIVAS